jgi:hypothetical protein
VRRSLKGAKTERLHFKAGGFWVWEDKRLRDITEAEVRQLVSSDLEEHLQLEYKSALYDGGDRGRKESLLDICMFAPTRLPWN